MDWNSENEFSSSNDTSYDSDIIDSDIEADLYSIIHHQQEASKTNSNEFNFPVKIDNASNKHTNQEKTELDKSYNNLEHTNKTDAKNSSKNGKNVNVDLSQNSKNFIEVQTIECKNELNNGILTKRKSSVVSDFLNNIQSDTRRRKTITINGKNKISECIEINSDSSDSDIIYMNLKEKEKNLQFNLSNQTISQFNLSNQTISFDFSSDSNDSWCDKLSNKSSISHIDKNLTDLWTINTEDKYRFKKRSNRYHESGLINCSNCKDKGHFTKNCSLPSGIKCYICGNQHNAINCPKRTCEHCFRVGHDYRFCKVAVRTCTLCQMDGHSDEECPDLWRRYHLTTSNNGIQIRGNFRKYPIFCYNCGISGHFGGKCINIRRNMNIFPTWPIVINYAEPYSSFKSRKKRGNNNFIDFEADFADKQMAKSKRKRANKIKRYEMLNALQTKQNQTPKAKVTNHIIEKKSPKTPKAKVTNHIIEKKSPATPQNDFPRTPKEKVTNKNTKKKSPQTQRNDFPRTPNSKVTNQNSPQTQQCGFPQTPTSLIINQNSPDVEAKIQKKIQKEKKFIRKMKILRQKILAPLNNISVPLLDLSGKNVLPYSFKSLKNRAKKERKFLRKLIAEKCVSNNISAFLKVEK